MLKSEMALFFSACCSFSLQVTCYVWLVALARSKRLKENEPEENPKDFPSTHRTSN
jgi:hypothetical protein